MTQENDIFTISSSTALTMGANLIATLNTITLSLPEPELRKMRRALVDSARLADSLIRNRSISSAFDMLSMSDVSIALCDSASLPAGTPQAHYPTMRISHSRTHAPPPSPVSLAASDGHAPRSPVLTSGTPFMSSINSRIHDATVVASAPAQIHVRENDPDHPIFMSSRPRVGVPDYNLHPTFIDIGIPGPYSNPPTDPSKPYPTMYFVITKGLYVGIFSNWNECAPWVTGIPGCAFAKVRNWSEAMDLYNGRLAVGACEVLS